VFLNAIEALPATAPKIPTEESALPFVKMKVCILSAEIVCSTWKEWYMAATCTRMSSAADEIEKLRSPMNLRILVADDHSIVRRGVRALLESHRGWRVCAEAATGQEAVRRARQLKPDVVVLDVAMPDLNGFDATRQIRESTPRTKVLILSMHESEHAVREALEAGAKAYIFKSDLDRDLLVAIDSLSQDKTFFSSQASQILVKGYLEQGVQSGKRRPRLTLTPRQKEVVRLLAEGKTNKEVAAALGISVKTAETHRTLIMRKLQLHSFSDLVRYAVRQHIIEA